MPSRLLAVTALLAGITVGVAAAQRLPIDSLPPPAAAVPADAPPPATGSAVSSRVSGAAGRPLAAPSEAERVRGDIAPEPKSAAPPPATPRRNAPADRGELLQALAGFSGKTNQERQAYIAESLFPGAGLEHRQLQPVPHHPVWGEEYGNWDSLHNIIAFRPGSLPDGQRRRIVIGAHYDKVTYPWRSATPGKSDGILDNGSGVAVLALIGATLQAPQNDFVFVALATEEPPPFFNGSKRYFAALSPEERSSVAAFVNLDVLGRGWLAAVVNSSPPLLAAAVVRTEAEGIGLARIPSNTNNNSDHLTALAWGIPALALACTDYDARHIHVPEDNMSAIDPEAYFQHYLGARLAVLAVDEHVAAATAAEAEGEERRR